MTGGSRIVAFGPGGEQPHPAGETAFEAEGVPLELADQWPEALDEPASVPRAWFAPVVAGLAIVGWTGFFLWAFRGRLIFGITPSEGAMLVGNWATPVLLICVIWLIALRTSRREARRFGEAAYLLSCESARLETRLTVVNRELSLAREFIAAQSRDLESLGRLSAERISEHAERLQALIRDNGAQVEAISGVSGTALDNMERLRGQLPVIASSAKDVANTIGHAGRTAQGALSELVDGLARLTAASTESEGKAEALRERINASISLFDERLEQLQAVVAARLEELEHRGAQLRARLEDDEAAARDALRDRAAALSGEIEATRAQFEGHEAEALISLRARLSALRDEGAALARALRNGEAGAFQALEAARDRLETEIRGVLERLDKLDRDALEAARSRIATLSAEAGEFDDRLAERNLEFTAETERRLGEAAARHDAEVARLAGLFEQLDSELSARLAAQDAQQTRLAASGEAIAARLEELSDRIAAISAFGNQADESLGNSLRHLAERLGASREALAGTDAAVAQLTDGSVRLLELLQASTTQSRDHLPEALAAGLSSLEDWETRTSALRDTVEAASARGTELARTVADTHASLGQSLGEIGALQNALGDGAHEHGARLEALRESLVALDRESTSAAELAQGQLTTAIDRLAAATRAAVATLGDDTQGAITTLADRLGEESAAAIDRVMRVRMAEAVGQLEQAAGHAAGVSREAAIQLRDQLAKVDELASNLERRVAQARDRAEEQVDHDFARRVALITESLNSNAIDIAKALSTEVTDTAWAAYLKGDRGVFTRRAVRLIDTSEAREITRIYEDDSEFRDHVSRYIHDFEAMLRQLLSTRDGHALGVTLLSSDMGKLYVVLAQAIERLRA